MNIGETNRPSETRRKILNVMRSKKLAVLIAFVVVLASLLLAGVIRLSPENSVLTTNCTLSVLSGNTEIQKKQTVSWIQGDNGMTLSAGDLIKTTADSEAMLTFFEGSTLHLGPETQIEIQQISQSQTKQTIIILKQMIGTTWSRVEHMADAGSRYEIDTPASYALVRGTTFMTEVDQAGATTLEVSEGTVAVQAQGKEVLVPAGYKVNVEPGIPPGEPEQIKIEPSPVVTPPITPTPYTYTVQATPVITALPTTIPSPEPSPSPVFSPTPTPAVTPSPTPTPTPNRGNETYLYNLTLNSSGNGNVSRSPSTAIYNAGTIVTLTAIPSSGWSFSAWSGDLTGSVNPVTITMDRNKSIHAIFSINACSIDASVLDGHGTVNPANQIVDYGSDASINIAANTGYHITGLTDNGSAVTFSNPYVISNVTSDHIIEVTTVINTYNIIVSSGANGSINPSGTVTASYGDSQTFAISTALGFHVCDVVVDGSPIGPVSSYTFNNLASNHNLSAAFAADQYDLTVTTTGNGSVNKGPDQAHYNYGDAVTLTAVPSSGWSFSGWSGDLSGETNPVTVTMDGNKNITATFSQIMKTLTVTSGANGSVTQPGTGTFSYGMGTVVNLQAAADSGFVFVNWTGDVSKVANVNAASTTIVMDGDYSVQTNFIATYTLIIVGKPGGTVTGPGTGTFTFNQGAVVNLVAVSEPLGYEFETWEGQKSTIADEYAASTTITMNGDYTINPKFRTIPIETLTINILGNGSVSQPGEGTFSYNHGTVVNLAALPGSGSLFQMWIGDTLQILDILAGSTTITMNGDYAITAVFVP
jgi:uncharacterized repeat protein (TIGR02543 family)